MSEQDHDDQLSPVDGIHAWPHDEGGTPDAPNSGRGRRKPPPDNPARDEGRAQVATTQAAHRLLLSEPSGNVGRDDRPHFLRIEAGKPDLCGQCGKLWPCPVYSELAVPSTRPGE